VTPSTFAAALRVQRISYQFSHAKVAQLVGVSKQAVRDWEEGLSYPTGRDIARLRGVMPKLGPFLRLIPREARIHHGGENYDTEPAPQPEPEAPPVTTFSDAVRLARLGAGLDQGELGELVGVTGQAVSAWETEGATPVREHYERLLDLMPELRGAPEPNWRDIPPPDGGRGVARDGAIVPAPRRTWRDRLADAIARSANGHGAALTAMLASTRDRDQAIAELDALIRAAEGLRRALGAEPLLAEPLRAHPAGSGPVVPPGLVGALGAAARWSLALIRVEIAAGRVTRLEASLEKARTEAAAAKTFEATARHQAHEEARREADEHWQREEVQ
jgi:transcriptional regulator with XRE-family HTH domain